MLGASDGHGPLAGVGVTTAELRRPRGYLAAAEAGVLALAIGTAAGLTRLFTGWTFLGRLLVPLGAAWGIAVALRRVGVRTGAATAIHLFVGALVIAWWFAADTLWLVLPTPGTARALGEQISASFAEFSDLVAPVPASNGFLVVALAVLWVFASFADTASFRYRSPVQAAIPYAAAFVAIGLLARESGRMTSALWFAAGLGTYAVTQRALSALDERWVAGRGSDGTRSVVVGAAGLAVVALAVGLVAGPRLPGDESPVLDLRSIGGGDGPRTVVSPFVGLRSLLGDRSDDVMFSVRADAPSYWRLTALEEYDPNREIWISRGTYQRAGDDLAEGRDAPTPVQTLDQRVTVEGLSGPWLPAAFAPSEVDAPTDVGYDARSASIIVADERPERGLQYSVRSEVPRPDGVLDEASRPGGSPAIDPEFSEPVELAATVQSQLEAVVAPVAAPAQQLLALQDWFRTTFDYDESVDFTQASDPIAAFLDQRRGFCQQFASTFALMARSLGFPSRVAIGFTQGDVVEQDPEAGEDRDVATDDYVVRGRHAHAWPEVFLADAGWVAFEPTPQRGDPQAEGHTGVPPQQAAAPPEQAATTTAAPATAPAPPAGAEDAPPLEDLAAGAAPDDVSDRDDAGAAGSGGGMAGTTLAATAGALVAVALFAALLRLWRGRAWRRASQRSEHSRVVAGAWRHVERSLETVGVEHRPDETPVELAARARTVLGVDLLDELAQLETRRRYAAGGPGADAATRAIELSDELDDHLATITTRRDRLRHALVP